MFSGIVSHIGTVDSLGEGEVRRLRIACPAAAVPSAIGASTSVSGICLTAAALDPAGGGFEADLSPETLRRTTAGTWRRGERVNLEASLRIGDELGGHVVTGHVDATAQLLDKQSTGDTDQLEFGYAESLAHLIAEKGSIAVDGVSLTVAGVGTTSFSVAIIPHTRQASTLGDLEPGDRVNIEVDILARYVARMQEIARHGE